jgi:hypothetical protein
MKHSLSQEPVRVATTAVPLSVEEAKNNENLTDPASLKDQPIIKLKTSVKSGQTSKSFVVSVTIENEGNVKAKNIKSVAFVGKDTKVLGVRGGKVTSSEATWSGEVDPNSAQSIDYEFLYTGNLTSSSQSDYITIPLTISGSGSDYWQLIAIIKLLISWLAEFLFDIPISPDQIPSPGFESFLALVASLIAILYLNKRRRDHEK